MGWPEPVVQRAAGVLGGVGVVDRRGLGSGQPFGLLDRQVQHHVPVGDVDHLVGVGEAKATRFRHDDAVEDVQLGDLQHMLDGVELLATRGPSRPAHLPTRADWEAPPPGSSTSTTTAVLWHGT
jgi:hypothetical protein